MSRVLPDPPAVAGAAVAAVAAVAAEDVASRLAAWLAGLQLGSSTWIEALELAPLLHDDASGEPVLLMHDALRTAALEVLEQGAGSVNELWARNAGTRPVLVLEGERIVGAKQNRVVTLDVLVGPGETVGIPVGCVEQGRWSHGPGHFAPAESPMEPGIRARTVREMGACGALDQGRLWSAVASKLAENGVVSGTSDYDAFVRQEAVAARARALPVAVHARQVGMLALRDGWLVGLDVVGHACNWSALAPRLVMSYALAACEPPSAAVHADGGAGGLAGRGAQEWLDVVRAARVEARAARSLGMQVVLAGARLTGGGLWHADAPAHLAAFGDESGMGAEHRHDATRRPRWKFLDRIEG